MALQALRQAGGGGLRGPSPLCGGAWGGGGGHVKETGKILPPRPVPHCFPPALLKHSQYRNPQRHPHTWPKSPRKDEGGPAEASHSLFLTQADSLWVHCAFYPIKQELGEGSATRGQDAPEPTCEDRRQGPEPVQPGHLGVHLNGADLSAGPGSYLHIWVSAYPLD